MLCTYVHLRIDIDLSNPLLRDEHNIHANSMQQILHNSSENELIFFASPPYHIDESSKPRDKTCMQAGISTLTAMRADHGMHAEH